MGLDLLEFTLAIEESFGIYLPEADAVRLLTPGDVVDYLATRLPPAATAQCLEQLAFHRVRRAGMQVLDKPRDLFRPETRWNDLMLQEHQRRQWELIGQSVSLPKWPRMPLFFSSKEVSTVGGTARYLAARCPNALKGGSPAWTRAEIAHVVARLMEEELGVSAFKMSDRFVKDLGLS